MDTDLQQIPANLLRHSNGFAGTSIPIASAPSLAWLDAARKSAAGNGGRTAWISTTDKDGQTLAMIADRLTDTFAQHSITLDTGPAVPEGLTGSELVVVAAHGGLLPEKRYFQRVSDEGDSTLGTSEFANSLRNVGVVVLFVCSGGRADKHPSASTVIGFGKAIAGSRMYGSGCLTLASPFERPAALVAGVPPSLARRCAIGRCGVRRE